tara:strand:- start:3989 stop:4339 length:351 start_codon:yes stop_codon:yes gene_type:complete
MSSQEKSPASNEAPRGKSVKEILIDLANDKYESWKQFLTIESSRFLGKRLAITDATVAGLVRDNEILRARVKHVEQMCADLCRKHNQCYHSLIKIKEGHNQFIDETNAKLRSKGIT